LEALLDRYNSQAGSILEWHTGKEKFLGEELSKKYQLIHVRLKLVC